MKGFPLLGLLFSAQTWMMPAIAQPAIAQAPTHSVEAVDAVEAANTVDARPGICAAELPAAIDAIANREEFQRFRWGILVQTLGATAAAPLYAREAQQYFIPASNVKLLTTAAALTQLGADFQIQTPLYLESPDADTADAAPVIVRVAGRGDPSLGDAQLRQLAQQLRDRGIQRIDQLIADDHYFQGDAVNPNWEWEDVQAGYGAPANSLMLNQNALGLTLFPQALGQPLRVVWDDPAEGQRWRVVNQSRSVATSEREFLNIGRDLARPILQVRGQLHAGAAPEPAGVAIPDPSRYFLQRFRQILSSEQIQVAQTQVAAQPFPDTSRLAVAAIASAPLSELLIVTNRNSNNLYAESLIRLLGVTQNIEGSSLEAGIANLTTTLSELGVDPDGYLLADGSGLSRHNLTSPAALVQVLQAMAVSPNATTFRNSLAIAGESGTLRNRFRATPVQGRLWGKTGAMSGIAALSGYLDPPNYSPLAFSLLVNQFDPSVQSVRQAMDEIVVLLSRLQSC